MALGAAPTSTSASVDREVLMKIVVLVAELNLSGGAAVVVVIIDVVVVRGSLLASSQLSVELVVVVAAAATRVTAVMT